MALDLGIDRRGRSLWPARVGEPGIQKSMIFAGERQNMEVLTGLASMDGC